MARYSRVALYHKAQNASHNQPKLKPTYYKKDIVQIPEAKNEPVNTLHQVEDKKEPVLKPAVETEASVAPKKTKMSGKRPVKKSATSQTPKKKASGSKTKKAATGKKKSLKTEQKNSSAKSKKVTAKVKVKKSMPTKKPVKKTAMKKIAGKNSSKGISLKTIGMKKPQKKLARNNKKNTKAVIKRQTKKSN